MMTTLVTTQDPIDLPDGATIRRPDLLRPFVAMSSRKRWGACALSAVLPQIKTHFSGASSAVAAEGVEAHKIAECAIIDAFSPHDQRSTVPIAPPEGLDDFDYTPEGVRKWVATVHEHAATYVGNARALFDDCTGPTTALVEHKIEATRHGVKIFAVADVILWNASASRLVVGDYKYGRSPVGVGTADEPNEQCAGAMSLLPLRDLGPDASPKQLGLFVYQPRARYGDAWKPLAPLDTQWLAAQSAKLDGELRAVADAAAHMARGELPAPTPGDHCTYCPSARWCPAAAGYGSTALQVEQGTRTVQDLTPAEVMALWSSRSAFKQFEEDLRERVKILHEKSDPSVQVRRRTGNRIWSNPAATVEALMLADRPDLLQPPGVEKVAAVLDKDTVESLLTRAPDVLTYVASDGKQPSLAASAFAKYLTEGSK